MQRRSLYFDGPGKVCLRTEALPSPGKNQILVKTVLSAISPGTEMLFYRGEFPDGLDVDSSQTALGGEFHYPLKYGYAAVGRVVQAGTALRADWENRLVCAFHPHESHFLATPDELIPVPEDIAAEEAVFLPNMETAVNFIMDGRPLIGEHVTVFGQGIVGLLTTTLLAQFPLSSLVTFDRYPLRRQASLQMGAHASLDPASEDAFRQLSALQPEGADLVYELSGAPQTLDQAIAAAGFAGRVVIGSWYGQKKAALDLGGRFHRSRIRLVSSQVSTIDPEFSGRWDNSRRFTLAWEMLRKVKPSRFITQRQPLERADEAYRLLDQNPEEAIQVVFTY